MTICLTGSGTQISQGSQIPFFNFSFTIQIVDHRTGSQGDWVTIDFDFIYVIESISLFNDYSIQKMIVIYIIWIFFHAIK